MVVIMDTCWMFVVKKNSFGEWKSVHRLHLATSSQDMSVSKSCDRLEDLEGAMAA